MGKIMSSSILLSMAGGLGLFLFGMHTMSDAIEKAAGAKLRGILLPPLFYLMFLY